MTTKQQQQQQHIIQTITKLIPIAIDTAIEESILPIGTTWDIADSMVEATYKKRVLQDSALFAYYEVEGGDIYSITVEKLSRSGNA